MSNNYCFFCHYVFNSFTIIHSFIEMSIYLPRSFLNRMLQFVRTWLKTTYWHWTSSDFCNMDGLSTLELHVNIAYRNVRNRMRRMSGVPGKLACRVSITAEDKALSQVHYIWSSLILNYEQCRSKLSYISICICTGEHISWGWLFTEHISNNIFPYLLF